MDVRVSLGGSVVNNPLDYAGDTGSIPGPGRSHMPTKPVCHNYWACALEPRNHKYWAHVPQLLKLRCPRVPALQQQKPSQWEACTLQKRSLHSLQLEKSHTATICIQKMTLEAVSGYLRPLSCCCYVCWYFTCLVFFA